MKIPKFATIFTKKEFWVFFIVGAVATLVDWVSFWGMAMVLNVHYFASLVVSFSLGAVTNYILNKIFTFKDTAKKIVFQFSVFISLAVIALVISGILMFVFVDVLALNKMLSRIVTTGIVFFINYLMHRNITFNKKFFKQS